MRLFIAIEISPAFRDDLTQAVSNLKHANADVRWVAPGNIHLTLKFLGEIREENIPFIKEGLASAACMVKSFELDMGAIGAFPELAFPSIIWVGLKKGGTESAALAEHIEIVLFERGVARSDRPYSAHLTIGRVRSEKNIAALQERLREYKISQTETCTVTSVSLYQSILSPAGPRYTKIYSAQLGQ